MSAAPVAADAPAEAIEEPDALPGLPHPRHAAALYGQEAAERAFLDAFTTGRLHHAWLITGPRGVGKATLAWRIARFLLATPDPGGDDGLFGAPPPPASLDIPPDHPVAQRLRALSEPRLCLLRRQPNDKGVMSAVITVDTMRKLKDFLALKAVDGGRRAVIVDAADEMNVSAANALLKLLEEPPADTVILLVSHQPTALLPTIRSRCRELRCAPLGPDAMSQALAQAGAEAPGEGSSEAAPLAELAGGSVGEALRLTSMDGLETYAEIVALFATLPRLDRGRALKLAESCAGKANRERFDLVLSLLDQFLARTARTGAGRPPLVEAAEGEGALMRRLAPHTRAGRHWAEAQQALSARARHGRAVNLDPAALILDMVLKVNETALELGV